jgi:hypothetical protein
MDCKKRLKKSNPTFLAMLYRLKDRTLPSL